MADDVIFTSGDADLFADDITTMAAEQAKNEIETPAWNEVKQAARTFLDQDAVLTEMFKQKRMSDIQNMMMNPDNASSIINLGSTENLIYIRSRYLLAFTFDEMLTKWRGQSPRKALYIYENDDGSVQTLEMDMFDLIEHISSDGRIYQNTFGLMAEQSGNEKETEFQNAEMQDHLNHVQAAYAGASNRLARFFERRNEHLGATYVNKKGNIVQRQNQGGILMWLTSTEWTLQKVSNAGDLKEAYAAALLAECRKDARKLCSLCECDIGDAPYYDHYLISNFGHNYIFEVTNMPAVVEEDIIGPNAQWGVKSGNAQAPSLIQYQAMAKKVLSMKDGITQEEFEAALKSDKYFNKNTHRNIISDMGEAQARKLKQQLARQIGATY